MVSPNLQVVFLENAVTINLICKDYYFVVAFPKKNDLNPKKQSEASRISLFLHFFFFFCPSIVISIDK